MSYEDLNARSAQVGDQMRKLGVVEGDRVVLYLDNRPAYLESMFAVFRIGATVVPCNRRATADEVAFVVDDCGARLLVTDTDGASITDVSPCVMNVDEWRDPGGTGSLTHGRSWTRRPRSLAWIFYTSGTTGKPKGAMLSHSVLNFVTVGWLADLMPLDEI